MDLNNAKLDEKSIVLLRMIFMSTYDSGDGVPILKFRADNYLDRGRIDSLVSARFIEAQNDKYVIRLSSLGEIENGTPQVSDLLMWCEKLFKFLRRAYLDNPGGNVKVPTLLENTCLSRRQFGACFPFVAETSVLRGYTTDLNADEAYVNPAERILDYESFAQIVSERREWALRETARQNVRLAPIEIPTLWGAGSSMSFNQLLHPMIVTHALQKYQDGHLRNAVLDSVIAVFDLIRQKTGLTEDGDELIGKAFSLSNPCLILSEIDSESGKNDQKGFMQIFKGIYQGVRNPKAHSLSGDLTEVEAAQYLVLASLLARRVDEAILMEASS